MPAWQRPPADELTLGRPARPAAVRRPKSSVWLPLPKENFAEKALFGLLVLAAAVGVAYGFSCLLDLVQNWASVSLALGRFVQ